MTIYCKLWLQFNTQKTSWACGRYGIPTIIWQWTCDHKIVFFLSLFLAHFFLNDICPCIEWISLVLKNRLVLCWFCAASDFCIEITNFESREFAGRAVLCRSLSNIIITHTFGTYTYIFSFQLSCLSACRVHSQWHLIRVYQNQSEKKSTNIVIVLNSRFRIPMKSETSCAIPILGC